MTRAAARMLDPAHSDDAALCVGGLCSRLLVSDGRLPATAAAALGVAVVRRLLTARMTALRQGLLFVLARLVLAGSASGGAAAAAAAAANPMFGAAGVAAFLRQDFGADIQALPAVGAAEGGTLGAVLALWVEGQDEMMLFGRSGHCASALALAELTQLCRADSALAALRVAVEVEEPGEGRALRSAGPLKRKTLMVPLPQRLLLAVARTWVQVGMDDGDGFDDDDEEGDGDEWEEDVSDEEYDEEAEAEWARSVGIDVPGGGGGGGPGGGGGGFLLSDLLADDDEETAGGTASTFAEDVADAKELEAAQGGPMAAAALLEQFVKLAVTDSALRPHMEQCAPFLNPLEGKRLQELATGGQ